MTPGDLDQLAQVAEARFRAEQQEIRDIVEEEVRIRGALARIDAAFENLKRSGESPPGAATLSGADTAWRLWALQRKSMFNTELAQVLARKSARLPRVRAAFGKCEALRGLQKDMGKARRAASGP